MLRSLGKSLSPYNKRCVKGSFGIFTYPSGRSNAKTRARRFRHAIESRHVITLTLEFDTGVCYLKSRILVDGVPCKEVKIYISFIGMNAETVTVNAKN